MLERISAAKCPACGAWCGVLRHPVGTRWQSWVSFIASAVIHAIGFILLALWTWGAGGIAGSADEVLIGQIPEEVLTDQQESLAFEEKTPDDLSSVESMELEVVEPVSDAIIEVTGDSSPVFAPPLASGSLGFLEFDSALPGAGGAGGDWDGYIQHLRRTGLDIVIVFDSTGSMAGEIDAVKRQISGIMEALLRLIPKTRVGLCTYRDYGDIYVARGISMTSNIDLLQDFLAGVTADGGGDHPEAVDAGLRWAIENNPFQGPSRKVILVFGDAPPHAQNVTRCVNLAAQFRQKYGGIVSTVTCRDAVSLPEFVEIARAGGGEAFVSRQSAEIMTQLIVLAFGSRHRDKVIEALKLLESAR